MTSELATLASWLDGDVEHLDFFEPCLGFDRILGPPPTLRVSIDYECRPRWKMKTWEPGEPPIRMDFPLEGLDLAEAAASLRRQAAEFPERGKDESEGQRRHPRLP